MKWYQPIQGWHQRKTSISNNGYVLVWVPEHPKAFAGGWYYEHILVVERIINRLVYAGETIHHIDGNKKNNKEKNLFLCHRKQHDKAHRVAA